MLVIGGGDGLSHVRRRKRRSGGRWQGPLLQLLRLVWQWLDAVSGRRFRLPSSEVVLPRIHCGDLWAESETTAQAVCELKAASRGVKVSN